MKANARQNGKMKNYILHTRFSFTHSNTFFSMWFKW